MKQNDLISTEEAAERCRSHKFRVEEWAEINGFEVFEIGEAKYMRRPDFEFLHDMQTQVDIWKWRAEIAARREVGYVYVLSNPSYKDFVKIGYSKTGGESRAKQLNTATPTPFRVEFELYTHGARYIEAKVHHELSDIRTEFGTEFFQCSPKHAAAKIIETWEKLFGVLTDEEWKFDTGNKDLLSSSDITERERKSKEHRDLQQRILDHIHKKWPNPEETEQGQIMLDKRRIEAKTTQFVYEPEEDSEPEQQLMEKSA